ncbi:HAMP domain-containing sensor histidine kinase [Paenibacillus sp.]|jgi:signal transduction histidine kinase|uniref:HAMP domain-containing sensor histidine kinase n=1 Tax=Paenibacillus sp. TaxID=58172 RepID=UPI00282DA5EF|nr:HAMP domain-containing sensor histidine kinase [Paenibacillus sp.]MDR0270463.1 HAMP domain-containing histidine kinase [Paenibacillus sp.]
MGLRNKMFLQHAVTIVLLLAAMYIVANYTLNKSMIERDTQTLSQYFALHRIEALKIVGDKKISMNQLFSGTYAPFIASHLAANSNFQVQLFAPDETIVGSSSDKDNLLKRDDIKAALQGQSAAVITEREGMQTLIYSAPIWYEGKIVGGFRYLLDLSQNVETLNRMRIWFTGAAVGCLILSLLASYSFASFLMRPLHALQRALKRVSVGDFSSKIEVNTKDEIGELADSFNRMSHALQHHIELLHYEQGKQKAFYDNITHEFKTPLTSVIGFSELISKMQRIEDIQECNQYIRKESSRLLNMVEELLQTSLKGDEAWRIRPEKADLGALIADSLRIMKPTLAKSMISTTVKGSHFEVYLDPKRTQQVLFNIIDNAIRHSECTHLHIELKEQERSGTITITDNGKGVLEQDLPKLFLPSEEKQDRVISKESHGLGLPLCKQLMELQGGELTLSSRPGKGTEVQLVFSKDLPMKALLQN